MCALCTQLYLAAFHVLHYYNCIAYKIIYLYKIYNKPYD